MPKIAGTIFAAALFSLSIETVVAERSPVAAQGKGLVFKVGTAGIDMLSFNGQSLLATPRNGDLEPAKPLLKAAVDRLLQNSPAPTATLRNESDTVDRSYPWGRVSCVYRQSGNAISMSLRVTNSGPEKIDELRLRLLEITFPNIPDANILEAGMFGLGFKGAPYPLHQFGLTMDPLFAAPVVQIDFSGGVVDYVSDDLHSILSIPYSANPLIRTAHPLVVVCKDIRPGATNTFDVSLRFGPPGATISDLSSDIIRRYAEKYPFSVRWSDRRSIGAIYLANSGIKHAGNPRRWIMNDGKLDVSTDEGKSTFRVALLRLADNSIRILKDVGAQGMITWDPEGEQFMGSVYYGDPRLTSALAPETDFKGSGTLGAMDEYFERFREAGLKVGVCLRPQQITMVDGKPVQGAADNEHAAEILKDKLSYAKHRWGCTLFYVDSTVDGKHQSLRPDVFEEVAKVNPDVLIIPENESMRYFANTAPLNSYVHHQITSTPAGARVVYPQAFSVLMAPDGDKPSDHDALLASIRRGDILLFNCWYRNPGVDKIKKIYQEAASLPNTQIR